MMICSKCHVLCERVCPVCGKAKLQPAGENEPVLLMILTSVQAILVEPILEDSGIPYSKPGTLGSAFSLTNGMMLESIRYYVPFAAYQRSRMLIEEVFGEDEAIMKALHEFDPSTGET